MKTKKPKWVEMSRRGKAQPLLVIDSIMELYRQGYFGKAHKVKWNPNYRQFDNARWFTEKDAKRYRAILEKAAKGKKINLFTYGKEYEKRITAYRKFAKKFSHFDFLRADNSKLAEIFSQWFEHTKRAWCFAYDYIFINKFLPDIITSIVAAKVPDVGEQNRYLGVLFEADQPSELRQEKKNLVKLAVLIRKNHLSLSSKTVQKRMEGHLEEFAYLGFYNFCGKAYTKEDLTKRLKEYLDLPSVQFKKMQEDFKLQEKNKILVKQIIKKLKLDKNTVLQIRYIKRWASLSNYVEETYSYVVHKLWPLWQEICKRLKITYPEFYSLTAEETIGALKKGKPSPPLKKEAESRHKDHAFILEGKRRRILIGKKLKAYYQQEKKEKQDFSKIKELKGQPASPGKTEGRVRLVFSVHDVAKVERGNILVASATNPTYVPAMERAGAIVTDEGGLLSHAAIVSRELKVPCVVGAGIATKVFKDGQLIEVDASKGLVRVIIK